MLSNEVSITILKVFGMTRPGIEPRSPGPLAHTLPTRPMNRLTYLSRNISSTESDVNIRIRKVWNAIERLSIIWKSDLSDRIKRDFFQAVTVSVLLYGLTTWTPTKCVEKKLEGNYTRMLRTFFKQILEAAPNETAEWRALLSHLPNFSNKTNKTSRTLLMKQGQTHKRRSHTDTTILADL